MYNYDYGYSDYGITNGLIGGLIIVFLIIILLSFIISVIQLIGLWKIFKKAGKGGWEAIIPFYSQWVLFEISGLNWWWYLIFMSPVILSFIPLVNIFSGLASMFALFNCYYNLSKRFNKDTAFAICLTLFTPICVPILGLSKNNLYNSDIDISNNGIFAPSNSTNNNNYQNTNYQQSNHNSGLNEEKQSETVANTSINQGFSFCGNCGTKLDSSVKYCPNCGRPKN